MALNNRWSGSLITGGAFYAAGTTNYDTQLGSVATNLSIGQIKGAAGMVSGSNIQSTTTLQAGTGFVTANGDAKQYAVGTYIGSGAATAAIVATGLTTIHHVWLMRNWRSRTAGATTRAWIAPSPALAAGTPGSFYPLVGFIAPAAAVDHTLGIGAGATFSWIALGAKTISVS